MIKEKELSPRIVLINSFEDELTMMTQLLMGQFPQADIVPIDTECNFRMSLEALKENLPDVVVADLVNRWANPDERVEHSEEFLSGGGIFLSGFRCRRMLAVEKVPFIIFTTIDLEAEMKSPDRLPFVPDTLPPSTFILPKVGDIAPLANLIRDVLHDSSATN